MRGGAAIRGLGMALVLVLLASGQEKAAGVHGVVTDPSGSTVSGVSLTAMGEDGAKYTAVSGSGGEYKMSGMAPGKYTIYADQQGFASYESEQVSVAADAVVVMNVKLALADVKDQVTVSSESETLSVDPSDNAGAVVLSGADLETLPDDPDDLLTDLRALAGPGAGMSGSERLLDGFSGGRLPPKDSSREVRINQNPFSAEYDRLGYGRIEVFTKPGSETVHGSLNYRISDAAMNTRNPLLAVKPPYRAQQADGDVGGSLGRKVSWFVDMERRDVTDNAVVSATVLDPNLQPAALSQAVQAPFTSTAVSPRMDVQLNGRNTLTVRYSWLGTGAPNEGVGQFVLPTAGYGMNTQHHTAQVTETATPGAATVIESGFQFSRDTFNYTAPLGQTSLRVLDSFTGGGAPVWPSFNSGDSYELHELVSMNRGRHTIKFGGRVRGTQLSDTSYRNFGGTFVFAGGTGPELNAQNQPVLGPGGVPVQVPITSIESYQRTLQFQAAGLGASQIRALGGGPSQYLLNAGAPFAALSQADAGVFVQDDWRVRPNFSLSAGLRYEMQSNLGDYGDVAPRIGFAWSPGKHGKTVIRGGAGVFYDRFPATLALTALRFGGLQQQLVVPHPAFYPNAPGAAGLSGTQAITYQMEGNLRAPMMAQGALSVERQISRKTVVSVSFVESHGTHLLRMRDINAPIPGTYPPNQPMAGVRPYGPNDIYQYESAGLFNQRQVLVNYSRRLSGGLSMFGYYAWMHAMSNTDGPGYFVSNPYNANADYGRSAYDVHHSVVVGATYAGPFHIIFSPFLVARSGAPFDITTGQSPYGDLLYNARPSLAASALVPGAVATPLGIFQTNPGPGAALIAHNYGQGPAFVSMNMRVSRTFGFGALKSSSGGGKKAAGGSTMAVAATEAGAAERLTHDASTEHRYNLVVAVIARNVMNHFNPGLPVGDLSSPLFGGTNWMA